MTAPRQSFRKQGPSATGKKIALMQCIMHREGEFTDDVVASFVRCYGQPEKAVRQMIAEEMQRREARARC